ncbi:MAG: porin family protein [Lentimicrobium sp.]|nr:porin family protein [Lentimicrobium sp.]
MKKLTIFLILAAGVFMAPFVSAQSFTSAQYSIGIPFGGLKDHTDQVSFRGFTFEYQREVAENVSVGVNLAYSVFYERKDYDSYTQGNATLTGVQYRYNNMFPMLVNAHYNLGTGAVIPYAGLGLGTLYNLRNTDMGVYTIEENNWHFLISPELGAMFDISAGTSIKINAKYDMAFKTKDADGLGNLNFNIGLVFLSF